MAREYTPEELGIKPEREYTLEELESMHAPESGGIASFKSALHDIAGQGALTLGKVGLMNPEEAQKSYEEHKEKSAGIYKPTEKGWTEDPFGKFGELIGGSVPYMAAPLVGAVAAPELIGGSLVGAGLASAGQFVGSNLARQLDEGQKEGKNLADTSLTSAVAASIPQAILDTYSLKMTPLIRGIFGKAGKEITEKTAEQIAKKGILGTITETGLTANREGITEAGQQVLERLQAGLNLTDEEARKEYFDNYIGGAILGGTLGASGHFVEKSMQNNAESRYDALMNDLRNHFDTASQVPMTDVINKISDLTGETDLNKIQNFLGGAEERGHLETVPNEDDTLSIKFKQPTPIEQEDEKDKNSNPDIYKPEVFDSHADLYKAIVPKLRKFGLENVGVKIMDSIENGRADGLWANKIIHLAMDSANPVGAMRHESVHALRELGGFKPNEWTVLNNKAKDEWLDRFIKKPNLYDQYKEQYLKDYGNLDGFEDYIHEEAIAEAFKHFDQTKPPAGLVGNIYERLKQFFETVRNGFAGNGFHTADSIFRSLEEGKRPSVAPKATEVINEEQIAPQYAKRPDLTTKEGIISDGIERLIASAKKHKLNSLEDRYAVGLARADTNLSKIEDGILQRLKDIGVSDKRDEKGDREIDNVFYNQILPEVRWQLKQAKEENEQTNRYAFTPERHKFTREALQSYRQRFGATSKPYTREGGENGRGNGLLIPTENFKNSLQNVTPDVPPFQELGVNGASAFHNAIMQAKASNPSGASVHAYPVEDYRNMRMFLTPDGGAGFALKGNDIVSVFSNGAHKNIVNPMIQLAIQEGGRKLDAFDTILPHFYHNNGFVVTSRMKWNDEYAPEGWDKKHFEEYNNGEPDVVFMAYDPDNHDRPHAKQGKLTDDYDEAVRLQEKAINEKPYKYSLAKYDKEGNPIRPTENAVRPSEGSNQGISLNDRREGASTFVGHHYSKGERQYLSGSMYGSKDGIKGEEAKRLANTKDPRIKKRVYFYIPHSELNGRYLPPEQGLGPFKHEQTFNNILAPGTEMSRIIKETDGTRDFNRFESAVVDAGYDGYAFPHMGMMVILNQDNVPVNSVGKRSLRAPNTPAFKRWFGNSKIVNPDGIPKVMYHGTAQDISEFRPKQANAIFVTDNPNFAEGFSDSSMAYMEKNVYNNLPLIEKEKLINKAINNAFKNKDINKEQVKIFKDADLQDAFEDLYGMNNFLIEELSKNLPSNQNILPLYVRSLKPFDYENINHFNEINKNNSLIGFKNKILQGSWTTIEDQRVQKAIKDAGFDGFYVNEGGHKNLAVYEPSQLKSATGNQGTFDIKNPDIRYSLPRLTKTEAPKTTVNVVKDTATKVWDDIHNDDYLTKKRVEWVDKTSGLTKALQGLPQFDMNGKLRADLLIRAKSQGINYIKNAIQSGIPILNTDGTLGVKRSENNLARSLILADQLDAKFKPFGFTGRGGVAEVARILRGEDIIKEDDATRAQGSAMIAQANAHLKMAQDLKKLHKFELEYAKQLTKEAKALYNAGKLREGNLKASEARRIYETNFYREILKETKEARKLMREGKPLLKVNRELQVTPAHIRWAHNMLDKIPEIENVLGIWREVNRGLVDLWVDTGLLDEKTAQQFKARDRYVPLFKSREDLDNEGLFNPTGTGIKSTAKIHALKGGTSERNIWENIDKHFAKMVAQAYENQTRRVGIDQLKYFGLAMDTTEREKANILYKEDGKVKMAIVENPNDLAAFQAMTYQISPLIKTFVPMTKALRAGALINPMYWIKQLIRDPIHASLVANSGIVTPFHSMVEFAQILAKNSEEAKILADRGVIGAVDSTMSMNEFLRQVGKEKTEPHALAGALHKIMEIHEASDAATRVAIYKKAYAEGMKKFGNTQKATDYAVFKARESINFSVHGNSPILQNLRSSIPFFSAAITSLDTVYRAATGYGLNEEEKAQARRIFATRAAMMAFLSTVYAMMYQDDDEYKKLPDYVKDNNWLIPTPDGKSFIKVPTPFEIGFLFKTIPEGAVRYMTGTSTGKELVASYYGGLLQNLPANGIPVPQAIKPILEDITNHSFFTGNPIEGMSDQGLPVSMRGQRATEFAKMLSRLGLDGIGLSPAKIDNLFQGYFAELGTFSTEMASDVINLAEGRTPPAKNIENMPFMKSFLTDPNISKAVSDFYSLEANAKQMAEAFNKFKSEGNIEGINSILADEEKKKAYASSAPLRKIGEEMTKIRKAINYYKENQDISPEERRQRINELTQVYNKIAENGYVVANAVGINR